MDKVSDKFNIRHLRHESPGRPSYTCPTIDRSIKILDAIRRELESHVETLQDLTGDDGKIELVRTANEELREDGSWWEERAEEMCDAIEELENTISTHEQTIEDLTSERDDLQLRISELQNSLMIAAQ